MKQREIAMYMDIAYRVSKQSYAKRLKVGAVLVTESGLLSIGYNGTYPGSDNSCEDEVPIPQGEEFDSSAHYIEGKGYMKFVTKPDVYHAEENVISKMLEEGVPAKNGAVFLTHSPCFICARILAGAKIKALYYGTLYRSVDGIDFLKSKGITVEQYVME